AGTDECHARKQAQRQQREEEREERDFLAAKYRYGSMHGVGRGPAEAYFGVRRQAGQDWQVCGNEGGEEPASPRTPPARRPDWLRRSCLSPSPQTESGTAIPGYHSTV